MILESVAMIKVAVEVYAVENGVLNLGKPAFDLYFHHDGALTNKSYASD